MEIDNWERLVVVTAVHGEKYMGWIPEEKGDPKKYMDDSRSNSLPIVLLEVRNYLSQAQPNVDPSGRVTGVAKMQVLLPLDMFPGALKKMSVLASAWYFPSDDPRCKKPISDLLEGARRNEKMNSAIAAGITPAGVLGKLPPPPGPRQH